MVRLLVILVMIGTFTANSRAQDGGAFVEIERIGRGHINDVFWSPDGETVAVTTSRGIWFYQADDLTLPPRWIEMDSSPVIAFDPMWQNMAIAEEGGIWLYDVTTGERTVQLKSGDTVYRTLAFSADGKRLAGAVDTDFAPARNAEEQEGESFIHVWGVLSQEQLDNMEGRIPLRVYLHPDLLPPHAMAFSPDGTRLGVSAQYIGGDYVSWQFFLLDLESGEVLTTADYNGELSGDFVLDDARVVTIPYPQRDRVVFDPQPGQSGIEVLARERNQRVLQISPDAQLMIVRDSDGAMIQAVEDGATIATIPLGTDAISQFSPDSSRVAFADQGRLGIYGVPELRAGGQGCGDSPTACLTYTDAHQMPELSDFDPFLNPTSQPLEQGQTVSADGQWMVSAMLEDEYGPYLVHAAGDAVLKLDIDEPYNNLVAARFSPDNRWAALAFTSFTHGGSYDHFVRVWDISGDPPGAQPAVELEHPGPLGTLTFSPDGQLLATTSRKTVYIWNTATWTLVDTLEHPGNVHTMTFSADNLILTTIAQDGVIRLWRR